MGITGNLIATRVWDSRGLSRRPCPALPDLASPSCQSLFANTRTPLSFPFLRACSRWHRARPLRTGGPGADWRPAMCWASCWVPTHMCSHSVLRKTSRPVENSSRWLLSKWLNEWMTNYLLFNYWHISHSICLEGSLSFSPLSSCFLSLWCPFRTTHKYEDPVGESHSFSCWQEGH